MGPAASEDAAGSKSTGLWEVIPMELLPGRRRSGESRFYAVGEAADGSNPE